ncbi:MAG: ABC transporter ATP-binding protein [Alphaproteobacteria bacterium]
MLVGSRAPYTLGAVAALSVCLALLPVAAAYIAHLLVDAAATALRETDPSARSAAQRDAIVFAIAEGIVLAGIMASKWLNLYAKKLLLAEASYAANEAVFVKTAGFGLSALEDAETQQRITLARQNANTRPFSLINRMLDCSQNLLTLLSVGALLAVFSPLAVLVVILGALPLFFSEVYFSGSVFRFMTGKTPELRRRNYIANLLTSDGAGPERIFTQADPELREAYNDLYRASWNEGRALMARRTGKGLVLMLFGACVFLGVGVWVVWSATTGLLTIGAMVMYLALLRQGQSAAQTLLATIAGAYEDLLYISNFFTLIDTPDREMRGQRRSGDIPGDGYRLENVSFRYPNMETNSVERVTLHLPPGSRLGILGENGSGKTTLVKLMAGLYLPSEGRITLDGTDLRDWAPDALFDRASILFQPYMRYRFSVADTIAMGEGLRVRDPDRIRNAAERGQAMTVIDRLPQGMDTKLSREFPDGQELSGGQWQRIALARSMLRDRADLLIFDEPTSALDPAAESQFLESLRGLPCSLVLITHRLVNLRGMDRIIVMDRGHVTEDGSHLELMARGEEYARLYRKQAEPYEIAVTG